MSKDAYVPTSASSVSLEDGVTQYALDSGMRARHSLVSRNLQAVPAKLASFNAESNGLRLHPA